MASKINDLDFYVNARQADTQATTEVDTMPRAAAYPRHNTGKGHTVRFQALFTEASTFRRDTERLAALFDQSHVLQVDGAGFSDARGDKILAMPLGVRSGWPQGGTHGIARGKFLDLGRPGAHRGRLDVQVRTIANTWSKAGITRALLPTGSVNPDDTANGLIVDTPTNDGFTDNWGDQDTGYDTGEVARGMVVFDIREGFYGNYVQVDSPSGTDRSYPGAGSTSEIAEVHHRRGKVQLDPGTGEVTWVESGNQITASISGFDRWVVKSWKPWVAELLFPDSVVLEVHAHGLTRWKGLGSKLTFNTTYNDHTAGSHAFVEELTTGSPATGTDWWITSTEDWTLATSNWQIQNGGDGYVFYDDSADNGDTLAKTLFKDTRQRLRLEVV